MDSEKPVVVVLSRNYPTGLSVIRSLGEAGYTVDLVTSAFKQGLSYYISKSKYIHNYIEVVSSKFKDGKDEKLLFKLVELAKQYDSKPVLIPTDDYTSSHTDLNRAELEKYYIMPSIVGKGTGAITKFMDKTIQTKFAKEAGIDVPMEWIISLREKEIVIPKDVVYPCFCKPIVSITGYKKEMARCDSKQELFAHLSQLRKNFADREILVQEFLDIDYELDVFGLCADQKVIIPAIIKKTQTGNYERGVALSGVVMPFEELGDLCPKIIEMMKKFHYIGVFDMDLSVAGERILFNEVNLRTGGLNYACLKSGVNLPDLYVRETTGEGFTEDETKLREYGKTFAYEKVAWDDYIYKFITKKELKVILSSADMGLLHDDTDPVPGRLFTKRIKEKKRKVRIRELKRYIMENFFPFLRRVKFAIFNYPQRKKVNRPNPKAEKPRVMVVGQDNKLNFTVAETLGRLGYEVEIMRFFQGKLKMSQIFYSPTSIDAKKAVKAYYLCASGKKLRNKRLMNRLVEIASGRERMPLISTDDFVAGIIDKFYNMARDEYYLPNVGQVGGGIRNLILKTTQREIAEATKLNVVPGIIKKIIYGEVDKTGIEFPCTVKFNNKELFPEDETITCQNETEFRNALDKVNEEEFEILIEKPVGQTSVQSITGVCKNGTATFAKGEDDKMTEGCKAFMKQTGYTGTFTFEMFKDDKGKRYFSKVEFHPSEGIKQFAENGIDFVKILMGK